MSRVIWSKGFDFSFFVCKMINDNNNNKDSYVNFDVVDIKFRVFNLCEFCEGGIGFRLGCWGWVFWG